MSKTKKALEPKLINRHSFPINEKDPSDPFSGITSEWYVGYDIAYDRLHSFPVEQRGVLTVHQPLIISTPVGILSNCNNDYYIKYHRQDGLWRVDLRLPVA
jgi:hypothetical protein